MTTGAGAAAISSIEALTGISPSGQTLLWDDFNDGNLDGWRSTNLAGGTAHWYPYNGGVVEDSGVYGGDSNNRLGTYLWYDKGLDWADYELSASLYGGDNDGLGLIFRYQDPANYYKLEFDRYRTFRKLYKVREGTVSALWSWTAGSGFEMKTWFDLKITVTTEAGGARIRGWMGAAELFSCFDAAPVPNGTVAMYAWGMNDEYGGLGAWFDNLRVRRARSGTEGSAIRQTVTVPANTTLLFDWNFLTNEGARSAYNDGAFISIGSEVISLADTYSTFTAAPGTGYGWQTGYTTFMHTFAEAGTYTIGLGVLDVNSAATDSSLLIDNVQYKTMFYGRPYDPIVRRALKGVCDLATVGNTLYAAAPASDALAVFTRLDDGRLAFREAITDTEPVNVALGKLATQSSTYQNLSYAGADRAVDGDKDAFWVANDENSISHTAVLKDSWWQVDLGARYNLDHIVLFDRYNLARQLSDFDVIVLNGGVEVFRRHVDQVSPSWANGGASSQIDLPPDTIGDAVKLQLTSASAGVLVMAECEVYTRGVRGLSGVNSLTLSDDGTRLYTTGNWRPEMFSEGGPAVAVFDLDQRGNPVFLYDINTEQDMTLDAFHTIESISEDNGAWRIVLRGANKRQVFLADAGAGTGVATGTLLSKVSEEPVSGAPSASMGQSLKRVGHADFVDWTGARNVYDWTATAARGQTRVTIQGYERHYWNGKLDWEGPTEAFVQDLKFPILDIYWSPMPGYSGAFYLYAVGDGNRLTRVRVAGHWYYNTQDIWSQSSSGTELLDSPAGFAQTKLESAITGVAETIVDGRRILYVSSAGSNMLQPFDVSHCALFGTSTPTYSQPLTSLDLSSVFNADVIVNNGAGSLDTTQNGWHPAADNTCYITQSAAVQLNAASGNGLPDNGIITGSPFGYPVKLGYNNASNGNNALFLTDTSVVTILMPSQMRYSSLYLLGASGWGDAQVFCMLYYADGSGVGMQYTVDDCYDDGTYIAKPNVAIINDMDWHRSGAWINANELAIFAIPLSVDDHSALTRIEIQRISGSDGVCIFGIVGNVAAVPLGGMAGTPLAIKSVPGTANGLYVLGKDTLAAYTPDPKTYSLTLANQAAFAGVGPAGMRIAAGTVYVPDAPVDTLRAFPVGMLPRAADWTAQLAMLTERSSPAPTTSITDIPGGVKFIYEAMTGGSGWGTSTVQYDFTTTAAAAGRRTFDITYSGFHAWYGVEFSFGLVRNGVVVQSLGGAWPDGTVYSFDNISFDLAAGDTYGIRVTGGNYDALLGTSGEITLVDQDFVLGAEQATAGEEFDFHLAGLESVCVAPDGRFAFGIESKTGALVSLNVAANGDLSVNSVLLDSTIVGGVAIEGLKDAIAMAMDAAHHTLYVLSRDPSPDADVMAVCTWDPATGALTWRRKVSVGEGASGLVVSPDGQQVYASAATGVTRWTRQPDGQLSEAAILAIPDPNPLDAGDDATDWVLRQVMSSGQDARLFLTSNALGVLRIADDEGASLSLYDDEGDLEVGIATDLEFSPDGSFMFITDLANSALRIYMPDRGTYVLIKQFREGEAGVRGIAGANGVAVHQPADGPMQVYVTGRQSDALAVIRLNAAGTAFELAQVLRNGARRTLGLKSPNSVAVDPVSGRVFVGSSEGVGLAEGGVATFNRGSGAPTQSQVSFGNLEHMTLMTGGGDDIVRLGGSAAGSPLAGLTLLAGAGIDSLAVPPSEGANFASVGGIPLTHGGFENLGYGEGTITLSSLPAGYGLVATGSAIVNLSGTYVPPRMTIAGSGRINLSAGRGTVTLPQASLAISQNGKLDLADNELVVIPAGDPVAAFDQFTALVCSARNFPSGLWMGPGITSSLAMADPMVSLAVLLGADGRITIKPALTGDANQDQTLDGDDYFEIDRGFLLGLARPTYAAGDFNYDRKIDGPDYFVIDMAFLSRPAAQAGGTPRPASTTPVLSDSRPGIFAQGMAITEDSPVHAVLAAFSDDPDVLR